jgi:CubicO group peptidase (beta-lactamase class C family)
MRKLVVMLLAAAHVGCATSRIPDLDRDVHRLMSAANVPGLAVAVIDHGEIVSARAFGYADVSAKTPLRTDTILYAASLTKAAFAYLVMQLVDEGLIDLDAPVGRQLGKPLPEYADFADLATDPRWQRFTPRMLLSHSSGLLNWRWINDDGKLDIKFEPGTRYVYSGEGIQLMQLIVEERTGKALADLMQQRVFDRFGMKNTSMVWRPDFDGRTAKHYAKDGKEIPHKRARRARAAGSMDTTLDDYATFIAGILRGDGLSAKARREMLTPQIVIVSPQQFPSHWPGETTVNRAINLSYGLGWGLFESTRGPAFFKEGHDDGTNNFALGFVRSRSGILLLSNSARAESIFYPLLTSIYGETCLPWFWLSYIPHDRPELRDIKRRETPLAPCGRSSSALPRCTTPPLCTDLWTSSTSPQ